MREQNILKDNVDAVSELIEGIYSLQSMMLQPYEMFLIEPGEIPREKVLTIQRNGLKIQKLIESFREYVGGKKFPKEDHESIDFEVFIRMLIDSMAAVFSLRNINVELTGFVEQEIITAPLSKLELGINILLIDAIQKMKSGGNILIKRITENDVIELQVLFDQVLEENSNGHYFSIFTRNLLSEFGCSVSFQSGSYSVFFPSYIFSNENPASKYREFIERADSGVNHPLKDTKKYTVVIAEDNDVTRKYLEIHFQPVFNVYSTDNGEKALELIFRNNPDLIISDVVMPGMDGYRLCSIVKENERTSHIPFIMLTIKNAINHKLEGLQFGADDYISKPFDSTELMVRAMNLIRSRENVKKYYTTRLMQPQDSVEEQNKDLEFVKRLKTVIAANIPTPSFNVEALADELKMSPRQLQRKLNALFGKSPNDIIRTLRLEHARQLLINNAGNVSEIAQLSGFASPAYFTKCFVDYYGYKPSEARRRSTVNLE